MDLPDINSLDLDGKRVLARLDLDVDPESDEILRLESAIPTLQALYEKTDQVLVIGHRGRPEGNDEKFSLKPVIDKLSEKLGREIKFEENLRFNKGETENSEEFARKLAEKGDFYINESFASSHREHSSIVGLPKLLPTAFGIQFIKEVENLSKVFENPKHPVITLLSGAKEDKLDYLKSFSEKSDKVLVGGKLPTFLDKDYKDEPTDVPGNVEIARLIMDREDITLHTIEKFEEIVESAKTVLVSGPLGHFEEEGHRQGTERIFKAVAENEDAFKVAGGGDTSNAIQMLGITEKFNWISTGGGAMLDFLSTGNLPGIQAVLEK